jgi:hypothetical protein
MYFLLTIEGTQLPIIEVISKSLAYVKSEALNEINKTLLSDLSHENINWVLTVPAIWNDVAKVISK